MYNEGMDEIRFPNVIKLDQQFNQLTAAQHERLAILLEEIGEAQQVIGKILRHGYDSRNPDIPNSLTNREALELELGDVAFAVSMIAEAKDINWHAVTTRSVYKAKKIKQWLHHQE